MTIILSEDVTPDLEIKFRKILTICFGEIFRNKSYNHEIPKWRIYIEENNKIISYLALHEKEFLVDNVYYPYLGIAEVCTLPEYRKQGLTKLLLKEVDCIPEFNYILLIGNEQYYRSSGFYYPGNVFVSAIASIPKSNVMVKCLHEQKWFDNKIVLIDREF